MVGDLGKIMSQSRNSLEGAAVTDGEPVHQATGHQKPEGAAVGVPANVDWVFIAADNRAHTPVC